MNKSLKWLLLLTLIVSIVTVFMLSGCKEEAATEEAETEETASTEDEEEVVVEEVEEFVLGYVPKAFISVYYINQGDAVVAEVEKIENMRVEVLSPVDQKDIEGQIKIYEDLLQKKIDALATSVSDPAAASPVFLEYNKAGIPIMLMDILINQTEAEILSLIGADEYTSGKLVGEYVLELLEGKGKVAILAGIPGQWIAEERLSGFMDTIAGSEIEVVANQPANWDRALATDTMENIIQANPDIDLVWGMNDGMALGGLKAIEDMGLMDDIIVVGTNGDPEALQAVKDGKLAATIVLSSSGTAKAAVDNAKLIMDGKINEVPETVPVIPARATLENINQFLE